MFQCFNMFQKPCNMDKSIIYQSKKRSCPKFQIKKLLHVKHGQIIAAISQVSMFRMFLYIINISLEHTQKVFSLSKRLRPFQLISRQDYTRGAPLLSGQLAAPVLALAICALAPAACSLEVVA